MHLLLFTKTNLYRKRTEDTLAAGPSNVKKKASKKKKTPKKKKTLAKKKQKRDAAAPPAKVVRSLLDLLSGDGH